jgi:hypothetical protein
MRALGEEPAPADLATMSEALDGGRKLVGPAKCVLAVKRLPDQSPLAFDLGAPAA